MNQLKTDSDQIKLEVEIGNEEISRLQSESTLKAEDFKTQLKDQKKKYKDRIEDMNKKMEKKDESIKKITETK